MSTVYYANELKDGLFLISSDSWTQPDSSVNCYLAIGKERALLVDAGLPGPTNLRAFAEELADGKPVICACSHGHFDHVGHASEFDEVWMSHKDLRWLDGVGYIPGCKVEAQILPLEDGNSFDLGCRMVTTVAIPGHTEGSMAFLDHATHTLIAGDAIARRGFFVEPQGCAKAIISLFDRLLDVERMDFDALATAHDRFLLPKSLLRHHIRTVVDNAAHPQKRWHAPDGTAYDEVCLGEPEDDFYINCSFPASAQPQLATALADWKEAHPSIWNED